MSNTAAQVDRRALLQNALAAVETMKARLAAVEQANREPIAIIGMSCRFPGGVDTVEKYWQLLHDGVDAVGEVPADRWRGADTVHPMPAAGEPSMTWYGGFLDQVDQFDPQFFGLSPREATTMDPQQRLILEVSWEALERAGLAPDSLRGSQTGIFVGITTNDYGQLALMGDPDQLDAYTATGSALNVAPGRVAYTLGLQGPSVAVDTACSSSLVAVHLACQSLRSGESDLALAGGVNVLLRPEAFICFSRWGMMAPDGRCKTFDARADGFVRGEGCGVLVLKRLSNALADGDNILAVIRGSAVNQDGRSSGLTVPNGLAQQALIRTALANAGVKPAAVSYVEAHGTGTSLGDPIEVEALAAVLGEGRSNEQPLFLSSVKTNMGHLESAAGIAGLMKVVLAMQHQEIPPHLHLQERSPRIPWPDFPTIIPTEPTAWTSINGPRLAGVSAFGFSGTNAHIVLEEAPLHKPKGPEIERPFHVLTLSARSESALKQQATRFGHYLDMHPAVSLADVASTANRGRAHFKHRLAIVAETTAQAQEKLNAFSAGHESAGAISGTASDTSQSRVAFLFTGQGSQYVGMGRQLYETQPTFRKTLDRCDELLRPYLAQSLLGVLYPEENGSANQASLLNQTAYTQPALFALEYALAQLWLSWGIKPDAVMGHSVGEYVAACVAGVFSLEDGLKLMAHRGRLMQALPAGGKMVAVFADRTQIADVIEPHANQVSIAAVNGPENVVISGEGSAVDAIVETLNANGIKCHSLAVSHAFHSPLMAPMLAEFLHIAQGINYHQPQIDLISNVTGRIAGEEVATASYWQRHVCAPVLFADAMETLHQAGYRIYLEVGPQPTLLSMGQRCISDTGVDIQWLPSLRPGREDWQQLLHSLGTLYTHGIHVDWNGFEEGYARQRMNLPTYPYQRQRYWLECASASSAGRRSDRAQPDQHHPFLDSRVELASSPGTHVWSTELSLERFPYLNDHRVQGMAVVPATAYLEMVMAAATQVLGPAPLVITDVEHRKALLLTDDVAYQIQIVLSPKGEAQHGFEIFSRYQSANTATGQTDSWRLHTVGKVRRAAPEMAAPTLFDPDAIRLRCPIETASADFYDLQAVKGNQWGPAFQGLKCVWQGEGEAIAIVQVPPEVSAETRSYLFHPAVSDSSGHVLVATLPLLEPQAAQQGAFVGGGIDEVRFFRRPQGEHLWAHARLRPACDEDENVLFGDVQVFDETGALVSETIGARLWYLDNERQTAFMEDLDEWFYTVEWQAMELLAKDHASADDQLWMICADKLGVADALARRIRKGGGRCLKVVPGIEFAQLDVDTFSMRPDDPADMHTLLSVVFANDENIRLQGAIHLWSLDVDVSESGKDSTVALSTAQDFGPLSVMHLVQALTRTGGNQMPGLWLVTRGAQPAGRSAPLAMPQTPMWGFGRSLAAEHPELWRGLIDLDPQATPEEAAASLWAEIGGASNEDQVAFRQGKRFVPRLMRQHLDPTTDRDFCCRSDCAYLITGGLGGLGLLVARWFVERGARHLVLLSRTPMPERSQWSNLEPDSQTARRVEALKALEDGGAHIYLGAVDVADESSLCTFMEEYYRQGHPPVVGVVHAAGVVQYQPILEHSASEMHRILRAKVWGGWLLHQIFSQGDLDFFVLFSSASTLLYSPMVASYAAGNTFLDMLAHHRKSLGLPAISINWGFWTDVGMVADFRSNKEPAAREPQTSRAMRTITPDQGLRALERCLATDLPQIGVFPIDWGAWQTRYPLSSAVPMLANFGGGKAETDGKAHFNPTLQVLLTTPTDEWAETLRPYLKQIVAQVLHLAPETFGDAESLANLGLDSLMALELKNRIEADLHITIPMIQLLQGPSVVDLQALLLAELEQRTLLTHTTSELATRDEGRTANLAEESLELLSRLDELPEESLDMLLEKLLAEEGKVG